LLVERDLLSLSVFAEIDRAPVEWNGKRGCDSKVMAEVLAVACPLRLVIQHRARVIRDAIWTI
jgi:hypothetical protein